MYAQCLAGKRIFCWVVAFSVFVRNMAASSRQSRTIYCNSQLSRGEFMMPDLHVQVDYGRYVAQLYTSGDFWVFARPVSHGLSDRLRGSSTKGSEATRIRRGSQQPRRIHQVLRN